MTTTSLEANSTVNAVEVRHGLAIGEMEHRFKNHLQLLASYARMASARRDISAAELAEDVAEKLVAIAGAHDALYRARGAERMPADAFLLTLAEPFKGGRQDLHVTCEADLTLSAEELAPLGMIVSEAISNALKHAFPAGRPGHVWIRLAEDDGRISLTVRDDGIGIADMTADRMSGRGLIEALAKQLHGYARLGSAPFGGGLVSVVYRRPS